MAMRPNGGSVPEVVVNFADGCSFSKQKHEAAYRTLLEKPTAKTIKDASPAAKKEDVDFIVNEMEIPRAHAERALAQNGGDLIKTLEALISA